MHGGYNSYDNFKIQWKDSMITKDLTKLKYLMQTKGVVNKI